MNPVATLAHLPPCIRCGHSAAEHDAPGTECVVIDCACTWYVKCENRSDIMDQLCTCGHTFRLHLPRPGGVYCTVCPNLTCFTFVDRLELERIGEREAAFQRRGNAVSRVLTWVLWVALAIAIVRLLTRWW